MCEIQEGTPYYRPVADTLLVDVTSHDMGGRYYCDTEYGMNRERERLHQYNQCSRFIGYIDLRIRKKLLEWHLILCCSIMSVHSAASPRPFLFTPTSLLLNHALITDGQQVTGKDGEQWINCSTEGNRGQAQIYYETDRITIASSPSGINTAKSVLNSYTRNGLYYCFVQTTRLTTQFT